LRSFRANTCPHSFRSALLSHCSLKKIVNAHFDTQPLSRLAFVDLPALQT
jgi:hypothetical protein